MIKYYPKPSSTESPGTDIFIFIQMRNSSKIMIILLGLGLWGTEEGVLYGSTISIE